MTIATLALCGGVAFSQSQLDAYRFSQSDLVGTARYIGMAGAFGALGGDISAMKTNPAGLAVYRSSEVVTTLSVRSAAAKTNWQGFKESLTKTRVNFDNIAYVGYFPTSNDVGLVSWNVGFAYNRLKNFHRDYTTYNERGLPSSLSQYMAARAYGRPFGELWEENSYDPYANRKNDWLSVLAANAGFIEFTGENENMYYSSFGENRNGNWQNLKNDYSSLTVHERGAIDQYDLSFGLNFSDILLLGGTVAITDINYDMESFYDEEFEGDKNDFYLDNSLSTDGTGYSFNIGAIVRPVDYIRLGVAYNSPTWYKMTDYYYADAATFLNTAESSGVQDASTPNGAYSDYEFRSPDRWIFSAAAIIGQVGLLSVDYEMTNYKNMKMYHDNGQSNRETNADIRDNFNIGNTIRVGAEVKVTPQFSVRAGGAWANSPMKDKLKNGKIEVRTVGTIPHYTVDKGNSNYTIGLGYRFTPAFYMDLACVLTSYKEDIYAFSGNIENPAFPEDGPVVSIPATLKTNATRVALTVGYKF